MKIGIIVHSKTGHSYSVAEMIKSQLILSNHDVTIEKVTALVDGPMEASAIQLENIPRVEGYDLLILGAPVRGFALSPIMKAYLAQLKGLNRIRMGLFLTQSFPFKGMGGNQAMEQFKKLCITKGGDVLETGIINWSNLKRKSQIKDLVEKMSNLK